MTTLDVGCGGTKPFIHHQLLEPTVRCDILKPSMKMANFIQCDAHHLPFKNESFNLVTLIDVLEHVASPLEILKEIKRVAKKLVLVTPNGLVLTRSIMSAVRANQKCEPFFDHIQVWTKAELENLFTRVGFKRWKVWFDTVKSRKSTLLGCVVLALCPFPALKYRHLVAVADLQ